MGMRNSLDPYGGHNPLVDKMIGNMFPVVQAVGRALDEIRYVAAHMSHVVRVSREIKKTAWVSSVAGALGVSKEVPLPEGVVAPQITDLSVVVHGSDGNVYGMASGMFTAFVRNGQLRLVLSSSAPGSLVGGKVIWRITTGH